MKVIIVENPGKTLVGVIDDWAGPIPGAGDYIFHPPIGEHRPEANVMSVKSVTWRMLARTAGAGHFTAHPEPCVEIHV